MFKTLYDLIKEDKKKAKDNLKKEMSMRGRVINPIDHLCLNCGSKWVAGGTCIICPKCSSDTVTTNPSVSLETPNSTCIPKANVVPPPLKCSCCGSVTTTLDPTGLCSSCYTTQRDLKEKHTNYEGVLVDPSVTALIARVLQLEKKVRALESKDWVGTQYAEVDITKGKKGKRGKRGRPRKYKTHEEGEWANSLRKRLKAYKLEVDNDIIAAYIMDRRRDKHLTAASWIHLNFNIDDAKGTKGLIQDWNNDTKSK